MDLPWNPAKLEQRIARAWRKNQTRAVQVINFVCSDSIEHRMLSTLSQKKALADGVWDGFGDLSEMAFPSARKDVLDHLADMMSSSTVETKETSAPSAPAEKAPVAPTKARKEQFKNDVIAHFNDRVQQLHVHENSTTGVKSILAVVDNVDRGITPKLEELVHANAELQQHQLQLLDQQTFALLQNLAAAGIITINTDTSQMLYRSPSLQASHETERQQRLTEAKKHQAEAARKKRMALLLMSGDFMIEALPVATDALNHGLKSYGALKKGAHQEGEKLMVSLKEPQMLSNDEARNLLEKSMLMIDVFSEEITKFALN
jgi:multidrug efflux pump subunit AcrA (membrane-fusion protein)